MVLKGTAGSGKTIILPQMFYKLYRNTYEIYRFAVDFCNKPELVKSVNDLVKSLTNTLCKSIFTILYNYTNM